MRIVFLIFIILYVLFPVKTVHQNLSLNEQMPENFFWGLSKTVFNDQVRRDAFIENLFTISEKEEIGQNHFCLFQKKIEEKNRLKRVFDTNRLNKMLNQKCQTKSEDVLFLSRPKWKKGFLYRSMDSDYVCRKIDNCAVIIEENDQKMVLGWTKYGTEVYEKKASFEYHLVDEKYDISAFAKKNNFKGIDDYVELSYAYGGLGNQLFTYWSGLIYALKNKKTVYRLYNLYLDSFLDLPVKKSTHRPTFDYQLIPEFIRRDLYKNHKECRFNQKLSFDNKCFSIEGHLQSWKNFIGYEDYIREHTVFKNEITTQNKEVINKMQNENAVSVHVRRGDYISQGYILLKQEYYTKAVDYVKQNVKNPHFYIFSNDQQWAKENIKIDALHTYVDWTKKDYEDLQLMTHCKHFINANSTFSWWGSFLSKNKNKIIISPDKHTSWDLDWIKAVISPNFVVIEVPKHYYDKGQNAFVTVQ